MKVIKYSDIKATQYGNNDAKGIAARVVIGKKDGAENICMRVFEFSPGGYSRKHSHDWEHEMFIHSGEGEFYDGNGQWLKAKTGDVVYVPSNQEHQIRNTSNNLLIIVCPITSKAPEL